VGQSLHGKLSKQQQTAINRKSLMFILINDIFFRRGEMGSTFSSLGRIFTEDLTGIVNISQVCHQLPIIITQADDASDR